MFARVSPFIVILSLVGCAGAPEDQTVISTVDTETTSPAQKNDGKGPTSCGTCPSESWSFDWKSGEFESCKLTSQWCDESKHLHCEFTCPKIVLPD